MFQSIYWFDSGGIALCGSAIERFGIMRRCGPRIRAVFLAGSH
jgi:hypothetical protein